MLSDKIAVHLRDRGHDVVSVVADGTVMGHSDALVLAHSVDDGRALVTVNIKDFAPIDAEYRAIGKTHAGLIMVSTKSFPQDRGFNAAVVRALDKLLSEGGVDPGDVVFLRR
jgi:hypothetical protein